MFHPITPPEQNEAIDMSIKHKAASPASSPTQHKMFIPPSIDSPKSSETSDFSDMDLHANWSLTNPLRPFKALQNNLLQATNTHTLSEAYLKFREQYISKVKSSTRGYNKNMRRTQNSRETADPEYWEKRRKNNEAAKKSRDARRAREDELAIRCAFLEQENAQLKYRLFSVEEENKKLFSWIPRQCSPHCSV